MELHSLDRRSATDGSARRIGFFGAHRSGKTTVATLVAGRLADRTHVSVLGSAGAFVDSESDRGTPDRSGLDIEWTVVDADAGPEPFDRCVGSLDTAFVVATPDTLDTVSAYEEITTGYDTDLFLIVTRMRQADRELIRAFDGPEVAEYVYEDAAIPRAMEAGEIPTLEDRTVEAVLIEALQPDRLEPDAALDALETRRRSVVNVEVTDRSQADAVMNMFENAGHLTAYYGCNCTYHDGHVLARMP